MKKNNNKTIKYIKATIDENFINRISSNIDNQELSKQIDKLIIKKDFKTVQELISYLKKIDLNKIITIENKKCLFFKNNMGYIVKDNNDEYIYISFNNKDIYRRVFNIVDILQLIYGLRYTKLIFKLMLDFDINIEQLSWWKGKKKDIFDNLEFLNDIESMKLYHVDFYNYFKNYLFFLKEFQMIGLNNVFHTDKKGEPVFFISIRHIIKYLSINRIKMSKSQISRIINAMCVVGIIKKVEYKNIDKKLTKISRMNVEKYKKYNDITFYSLVSLNTVEINKIICKINKLKKNKVSVMKVSKTTIRNTFSSYTANKIFSNQNAKGEHIISEYEDIPF